MMIKREALSPHVEAEISQVERLIEREMPFRWLFWVECSREFRLSQQLSQRLHVILETVKLDTCRLPLDYTSKQSEAENTSPRKKLKAMKWHWTAWEPFSLNVDTIGFVSNIAMSSVPGIDDAPQHYACHGDLNWKVLLVMALLMSICLSTKLTWPNSI